MVVESLAPLFCVVEDYYITFPFFCHISVNELNSNIQNVQDNSYRLEFGTAIPQNADLNDYKTTGNYYCNTVAIAQTLKNIPSASGFDTAFTLKVELSAGVAYPFQTLRAYNTGHIAVRVMMSSGWEPWRYIRTSVS